MYYIKISFISITSNNTELISNDTEPISNDTEPILDYNNNDNIGTFNKRIYENEVWKYFKKIVWEKE